MLDEGNNASSGTYHFWCPVVNVDFSGAFFNLPPAERVLYPVMGVLLKPY